MARRGARVLEEDESSSAERAGKRREDVHGPLEPPPPQAEWVLIEDSDGTPAVRPKRRAASGNGRVPTVPGETTPAIDPEVLGEVTKRAGTARPARRDYLVRRFEDAVSAYERARDSEVLRLLAPVLHDLPDLASARQLAGLAAYRQRRWKEAVRHLEAYKRLTADPTYVPIVMDGLRAQGRQHRIRDLWNDLRENSPDANVLAEARMVLAGSMADAGDLKGAIALLAGSGAARKLRNPAERHLRQWYALADLYDRAGDIPAARELFSRVARAEPDFHDVGDRLKALGETKSRARSGKPGSQSASRARSGQSPGQTRRP